MDFDFITTGAAAAFGFGIGWTASWAAGKDALGQLRTTVTKLEQLVSSKDQTIREQGREISTHRAAEQDRQAQRQRAARKAGEASSARAAAKRELAAAAAKVTKPQAKTKRASAKA